MSKSFFQTTGHLLSEIMSLMEVKFLNENEEYQKLYKDEEKILKKYKNLRTVWDDREVVTLNEEEINALLELRRIVDKRLLLAEEYMFLQGIKFYVYLLN